MPPLSIEQAFQLAAQHHQSGRLQQAEEIYRKILAQKPQHPDALNLLGAIALQLGRYEIAVDFIRQSIAINPHFAGAHNNLGNALKGLRRLDEAIAACRQAIVLKPNYPEAYYNLGISLRDTGRLDEAIAAFRQAIVLRPNYPEAHSNLIFTLHYHPVSTSAMIAEESRRWDQRHAQPLRQFIQSHANDRSPNRPLRIGYVSADFCDHASAFFLIPLFTNHDSQKVEIICYSQKADPDAMTRRFQNLAAQWRDTQYLGDSQLVEVIRNDRIDILVDLKLHTAGNRLTVFACKPAPIQVTWLGYPGTSGMASMDYRITDAFLDPPGQPDPFAIEKPLRLPHCFWCYDPLCIEPPVNPLPAHTHRFITFGSLNSFCKINVPLIELWARVLNAVQDSRMVILAPEGLYRDHLLGFLQQRGITPERIRFLPHGSRPDYLAQYHHIDIILDTFPYNGHTTTFDALWMGVPVVSLAGGTPMGRGGLSILSNIGLPELVASSPEQYVQIAVALANDLSHLGHLRATLRDRMQVSPLMNAKAFTGGLEAVYRQIWQQWCAANCG